MNFAFVDARILSEYENLVGKSCYGACVTAIETMHTINYATLDSAVSVLVRERRVKACAHTTSVFSVLL